MNNLLHNLKKKYNKKVISLSLHARLISVYDFLCFSIIIIIICNNKHHSQEMRSVSTCYYNYMHEQHPVLNASCNMLMSKSTRCDHTVPFHITF